RCLKIVDRFRSRCSALVTFPIPLRHSIVRLRNASTSAFRHVEWQREIRLEDLPARPSPPTGEDYGGPADRQQPEPCAREVGISAKGVHMERQLSDLGDGTARHGAVEIDLLQLCFLLGLFDRPHFAAEGRKDLARAAMPYVSVLLGGDLDVRALEKCARRRLSTAFVIRERVGQSAMWRLTPLGIA